MSTKTSLNLGDYFLRERIVWNNNQIPDRDVLLGIVTKRTSQDHYPFYFNLLNLDFTSTNDPMLELEKDKSYRGNNSFDYRLDTNEFKKLTLKEVLEYLQNEMSEQEMEVDFGGLLGAFGARKIYDIEQIIERLTESEPLKSLKRPFKRPHTGIHIIKLAYSETFLSNSYNAVVKMPEVYDEKMVTQMMELIYKDGNIGSISQLKGEYVKYNATEIPCQGVHLVQPVLEISIKNF